MDPIEFTVVEEKTRWPDRARWEAVGLEQANHEERRWRLDQERRKNMSLPKLMRDEERKYVKSHIFEQLYHTVRILIAS